MRWWIWLLFPAVLCAQDFEFQLQPGAFPVEISGWQLYQPWAGGMDPSTPEFCDIDDDSDIDFFTGSQYNYYWFFENIGSSQTPEFHYVSFMFDSIYPVCPGTAYESDIDFCDIDADGDLDAFLCNGCIGVAINQGTSSQRDFSALPDTLFDQYGEYLWATRVSAADIDADGDFDLFGGTWYTGELRFFENIGTAQIYQFELVTESWQNVQAPEGKADPYFGDLDADGDLDLLVGTGAGTIYFYRNDGDSANPNMTFVTSNYFGIDVGDDASPELADIDSDGDLDLFVGRDPGSGQNVTQGNIFFYENIGAPEEPNFVYRTSNYLIYDNGSYSRPLLVDIDADGDPDLFSHIGSRLIFYRNDGNVVNPYFVYETDNFNGISVFDIIPWFYDIDDDGDYDLFAGESAIPGPPQMYLFINRGTPQVPDFVLYTDDLLPGVFTQGSVILNPSMADIDADGDDDLFVSTNEATIYFFENVSTPSLIQFNFITSTWQNIIDPGYGQHMFSCFYDIDQDSDLDLFLTNDAYYYEPWEKNLVFYSNIGTPQNANMQLEIEDVFPELMIWQPAPYLLDIDQDGDGDLFLGDTWGGIRFFRNITGEPPAVPPVMLHPQAGLELSLGPNPANPVTWISFSLPAPQEATLAIYNILGARVTTLTSGLQKPGTHTYFWNASQSSSGVYIVRLETAEYTSSQRVTVVK